MRGHLIEAYRILRGLDNVDVKTTYPLVGGMRTLGHSLRVKGRYFRIEMRTIFSSQRVVNLWNSLLQQAAEAKSLSLFETEIDSHSREGDNDEKGPVNAGLRVSYFNARRKLLMGERGSANAVINVVEENVRNDTNVTLEEGLFYVSYKEA
eukprot:g32762.t1